MAIASPYTHLKHMHSTIIILPKSRVESNEMKKRDQFIDILKILLDIFFQVCPGKEGPIFFGDEQYGHVLSYTFFLADSQARGFRRWNSILVVMMDKIYLLNSWPFLVPHLKTVIENLQAKADTIFEMDEKTNPQRIHRLTSSRRGGKPARSLVELTGYNHVFKLLHLSFVWILKSCSNRISETLLEGPPTEDSIIDMEKQEGKYGLCMHSQLCIYMYVCMCVYIYIYMCIYVCVCVCVYIYIYIYIYIYMCMCVCIYIYIYIYMCVCVCMCIYIYIYIYICVCVCVFLFFLMLLLKPVKNL